MKKGVYSKGLHSVSVLVPKRRGEGFLRQATGGHHTTKVARQIMNHMGHIAGFMDIVDVDGYLMFDFHHLVCDEDCKHVVQALRMYFPHVIEWEKLGHNEFFDLVIQNSSCCHDRNSR